MRRVTITYTGSVEQELRSLALHWRSVLRPPVRWLARVVGALILAISVYSVVIDGPTTSTIALIVLMLCLFLAPWEARWRRRRVYRSSPTADAQVTIRFADEQLSVEVAGLATSTLAWPLIVRALRAPDGFLLYTGPLAFVWVPFAAFENAGDRAVVEDLLTTHLKRPADVLG